MTELLAAITYDPIQRWGPVSPHGVGTALGFFLGAWLMARRAEPNGIPRAEVYNAVTWGAVGALIGARGFYVLGHLDEFNSVRDMLAVWEGGLTMFGGFIGGLVLGLGYLRRKRFNIPRALDAAAPGFVVGVIVGRIGDIIIADHLGRPTDFVLGYRIPPDAPIAPGYGPPTYVPGAVVHHTALYDLAGAVVLLGFIYLLQRRRPRTGTLFATFALWYGVQRIVLDFTRNRQVIESVLFGLSGSQWAGLAFAVGGLIALYRISRRPSRVEPAEPVPEEPSAAPVGAVPLVVPPAATPPPSEPTSAPEPTPPPSEPAAPPSEPAAPPSEPAAPPSEPAAPPSEPEPPSAEPLPPPEEPPPAPAPPPPAVPPPTSD